MITRIHRIIFICAVFHSVRNDEQSDIQIRCGEEAPTGTPYIVGGYETNILKVPWHVGVYKFNGETYGLQCGGSILNARVIISAMHCFWDRREWKPSNVSLFRVAAGKEKFEYDAVEELAVQKFEVEHIFHHDGYNDVFGNYAADIALVVLSKTILFQVHISPICIPYGLKLDAKAVPAGWRGRVAGWGLTQSGGSPSPVLKVVELPAINRTQCLADSDIGFRPLITPDKFCAGIWNGNVSVCQGDSGGGLVFAQIENGKRKFYLRGIVSTGPNNQGSCDSDKYTTFTNVADYDQLIATYTEQYRPRPTKATTLRPTAASPSGYRAPVFFPEDDEEDRNGSNKRPALLQSNCKSGELLYPDDSGDDWFCDCRPGYVFHPQRNQCFEAFTRGPCRSQEYLILPQNTSVPQCSLNPCVRDGFVKFDNSCYELGRPGPCPYPELNNVIGVNETTLEIICTKGLTGELTIVKTSPTRDCIIGGKRWAEGKCK